MVETPLPAMTLKIWLCVARKGRVARPLSQRSARRQVDGAAAAGPGAFGVFGAFGALIERRPFYHYWHKARVQGLKPRIELFSLESSMAMVASMAFGEMSASGTTLRFASRL